MDRKIAKQLMETISFLKEPLSEAVSIIEQISDIEEKKKFRRGIGEIIGRLYTDLQLPIIKEHSDLDLDKDQENRI